MIALAALGSAYGAAWKMKLPPRASISLFPGRPRRLTAACDKTGSSSTYEETFSGFRDQMRTISASGCPNHASSVTTSSHLATEQGYKVTIPVYPVLNPTPKDLSVYGGMVAIIRNGVGVTTAYSGYERTIKRVNALTQDQKTLDHCGGHAGQNGGYHYNAPPSCLITQLHVGLAANAHSKQLGWALDGFPLYGPTGPGGVAMKVCGEAGAHAAYCLDKCNGFAGELPAVDMFKYRYYMTGTLSDLSTDPLSPVPDESFFPFTPICLRGCCPNSVTNCPGLLPSCDGAATAGTVNSFKPSFLEGFVTIAGVATPAPSPAPTPIPLKLPAGLNGGCLSLTGLFAGGKAGWTCLDLPSVCCSSYNLCTAVVDTLYTNKNINDDLADALRSSLIPHCYTHQKTFAVKVQSSDGADLARNSQTKQFEVDGVLHKTIIVNRGHTYRFEQSDASNRFQGLVFSTTPDGTNNGGTELANSWVPTPPAATPAPTPKDSPWRPTLAPTAFPTPVAFATYHGNLRGSVAAALARSGAVTRRVAHAGTPGRAGAYAELAFTEDLPATVYYYSEGRRGAGGRIVDTKAVGDTAGGCTCKRGWVDTQGAQHAVCATSLLGQAWCYVDTAVSPGCGVASALYPGERWAACKAGWESNVLASDGVSVPAGSAADVDAAILASGGSSSSSSSSSSQKLVQRVTSFVADMLAQIGIPFVELRGRKVLREEDGYPVRAVRVFDSTTHAGFDSTDAVVVPRGMSTAVYSPSKVAMVKTHPLPSDAALDMAAHGGKVEGRYDSRTKIVQLHLLERNEVYSAKVDIRR